MKGNYMFKINPNTTYRDCKWNCGRNSTLPAMGKHEKFCNLNPANKKCCPVCDKIMKNYKNKTCSTGCYNRLYRSGENNPNWKSDSYRTTCFAYHEKKCIICGENKIVAVHHLDENRKNNNPSNLIPLCPTHHQYCHSRYSGEIIPVISEYLNERSFGD